MSRSQARTRRKAVQPGRPAPAGAFVAVVEKRGRFLMAEPLFPDRHSEDRSTRRGRSERIVLAAAGSGGRKGVVRAQVGELVLVQTSTRSAGARVVRVLGRPDVARDVIEGLMLDRGLQRGFDPAIEHEAREAGDSLGRVDRQAAVQRRDLRELPTFTIDPVSARDFDDAVSAERLADGVVRVLVHIADVAAHVPEGSLLDREARRRATSVYVPGAVEPMLPPALSNDACSLLPGAERLAVTVELDLHGAEVVRSAFYRSVIRSDERLDYDRVDRIFARQEAAADPWQAPLAAAREVAAALQRKREQSGALLIDSEEPEIVFDDHGNVSEIRVRAQTESHRLIEHLMIAANEAVASLLEQRAVPCLYRVHEKPEPERVERLVDQLATLDVPTPALPEHMSRSQAAELVGAISKLVHDDVRRTGRGRIALSSLVLRSLTQAYYSPKNVGHAGLRSSSYCHFTSPIRRYPDLVCHRALLSAVGAGESAPRAGELVELGAWTSERERDAMLIERDADDVARCFALERVLYEGGFEQTFTGEIVGLISAGAFVAFGGALYRGMLPLRHLRYPSDDRKHPSGDQRSGSEWWQLNEEGTVLHGERTGATLRLGDPIEVRVVRIDAIRGRVDLTPA